MSAEILPDACGRCRGLVSTVPPVTGGGAYRHLDVDLDADHTPILGTPPPPGAVNRTQYDVEHAVEAVVIPPPRIRSVLVEPGDARVPRAARSRAKQALAAGWDVWIRYSLGPLLDATGTKIMTLDCESIVVKGEKPGVGIFDATWLFRPNLTDPKWSFDTAWCSTSLEPGFHQRNMTELARLINTPEESA